jgi:hypothetical protein
MASTLLVGAAPKRQEKLESPSILLNSRVSAGSTSVGAGFRRPKYGVEMKLFAVFVAMCALCQTALAQAPDCKSIADSRLRLGCYDKAAPPATEKPASLAMPADKAAAAKPAVKPSKVDNSKYVDTIGAEDALMNARLKNICKGC